MTTKFVKIVVLVVWVMTKMMMKIKMVTSLMKMMMLILNYSACDDECDNENSQ